MSASALQKLQDARTEITAMRASTDFDSYRRAFDAFTSAVRSACWKLEGETIAKLRSDKADLSPFRERWADEKSEPPRPTPDWNRDDPRIGRTHAPLLPASVAGDRRRLLEVIPAPADAHIIRRTWGPCAAIYRCFRCGCRITVRCRD